MSTIHNNLDYLDDILSQIIKEHYYQGKLSISLNDLFTIVRNDSNLELMSDYILLSYTLAKVQKIIPHHKWQRSKLKALIKANYELFESLEGNKGLFPSQWLVFVK